MTVGQQTAQHEEVDVRGSPRATGSPRRLGVGYKEEFRATLMHPTRSASWVASPVSI